MLFKSLAILTAAVVGGAELAAAFTVVTAEQAWSAMNPGWNLGNTLDAIPDEISWGNPLASQQLLDEIKASGFKSIRIPVTWTDHFATQAPDYKVNSTWMNRVENVVDWALDRQFWVVINVHHDSWQWADLSDSNGLETKFDKWGKLWVQIADRFKSKSERLIFESLNEPRGSTQEHAQRYNDMNQRFVNIIRNSGGYNDRRLLTLPGLNTNIANTVDWFTTPTNVSNWILHVHDYDPWDFVSTSWGRTFWGTSADKQAIEDTFINLNTHFQAPALIGEWGLTGRSVENSYAWIYFDFFVRTARAYNLTAQLWDNGFDHYDRFNHQWRDPVKLAIIINAAKGIKNSLPAYDQISTVFIKSGETIAKTREIKLDLNGNTISSVVNANGKTLKKGTEYTVSTTGINVTSTYWSSVITDTTLGVRDTLNIKFNAGISLPFKVALYNTPVIAQTSITVTDANSNLLIPFDGRGSTLATVKAVRKDGVYLKDDWTQYLGDLQKARINWGDFDVSDNNIVIYPALLQTIKASGQAVDLTFEFWPRTDSNNNATVTVTVA